MPPMTHVVACARARRDVGAGTAMFGLARTRRDGVVAWGADKFHRLVWPFSVERRLLSRARSGGLGGDKSRFVAAASDA
jgi:hypothetical protein